GRPLHPVAACLCARPNDSRRQVRGTARDASQLIPQMSFLEHLLIFGTVMLAAWFLFTYFWPRMLLSVFNRAILARGVGNGPMPLNTFQALPQALVADPL